MAKLAVLLLASLALAGTIAALEPAALAQSHVNIEIQNYAFNPGTITVVIGVNNTVTWTNQQSGIPYHTVTPYAGDPVVSWGSGELTTGESYTFTFTVPGTYNYHCSLHTYMMGTVIVIGSGSTTTSSTTSTSASSSSTTSTSAASSTTTATSATSTASTTSPAYSSGGVPEFPFQGVLVTVVTVAVFASYLLLRRGLKVRGPAPPGS
jgi:plastocyanin